MSYKSKQSPLLITETCEGVSGNASGSTFEGGNQFCYTAATSSKTNANNFFNN